MKKFNSDWIERNHYYCDISGPGDTPHFVEYERPVIVCLCGSTRFMEAFYDANMRETLAGKIVLSVGMSSHGDCKPNEEQKAALDELHKRKIDCADEVLILNVGFYLGDSTRRELEYARRAGKTIRFLEAQP